MGDITSVENLGNEMGRFADLAVEIAIFVWRLPMNELHFEYVPGATALLWRGELLFVTKLVQFGPVIEVACGGPAGEIIMMGERFNAEKQDSTLH